MDVNDSLRTHQRRQRVVCIGMSLVVGVLAAQPSGTRAEADVPVERAAGAADALLLGTPSCSARACHGGDEPAGGKRIQRDEYTTWVRNDPHASAYRVLFGERSRRIIQNLSPPGKPTEAHEDHRCLACHSVPGAVSNPDMAWMRLNGVGCEACHGPARNWLAPHTAPGSWSKRPAEEKRKLGMTDLDDPAAVARTCVGCHVGSPPDAAGGIPAREVGHHLLAAGHPRLNFEFTSFLANVPAHWNTDPRIRPPRLEPDQCWAAGQVVSARAAAELLAFRAQAAADAVMDQSQPSGAWPELAEYDCFACHHELRSDARGSNWRRHAYEQRPPTPGKLGLPTWGAWYFAMRKAVTPQPEDAAALEQLETLRTLMNERPHDFKGIGAKARAIGEVLRTWEKKLAGVRPVGASRRALLDCRESLPKAGWDFVEQFVLAIRVIEQSDIVSHPNGQSPMQQDQRTQVAMQELFRRLAFPKGREGPGEFESSREAFDERLETLLERLDAEHQ